MTKSRHFFFDQLVGFRQTCNSWNISFGDIWIRQLYATAMFLMILSSWEKYWKFVTLQFQLLQLNMNNAETKKTNRNGLPRKVTRRICCTAFLRPLPAPVHVCMCPPHSWRANQLKWSRVQYQARYQSPCLIWNVQPGFQIQICIF